MATSGSIDFRYCDDSWYPVRLVLRGENLLVKYREFTEEDDELYRARDFVSLTAIEEFRGRFRPTSKQLQDDHCDEVIEGMIVCASYESSHDDLRFYNALVEEVEHVPHGPEDCTCIFHLFWLDGPIAGTKTASGVAGICLLLPEPEEIDPKLTKFLKICREKLEGANPVNSRKYRSSN